MYLGPATLLYATTQVVWVGKNLPAIAEDASDWTWFQTLGREDPLEKEMATHSSIPARKIPRTEEPGGLQSKGHKKSRACTHTTLLYGAAQQGTVIAFKDFVAWWELNGNLEPLPIIAFILLILQV